MVLLPEKLSRTGQLSHTVQKFCVGSEVALTDSKWMQHLAGLTLEIKSGCLFCVRSVSYLSTERYFHFHVPG